MAGLACAVTLHRSGVPFLLFDRDEKVGGRVQTDEIDGYRLDRGFQVLLTAYPEAKRFRLRKTRIEKLLSWFPCLVQW